MDREKSIFDFLGFSISNNWKWNGKGNSKIIVEETFLITFMSCGNGFLGPKNVEKVRNFFPRNGLIWASKDLEFDTDYKHANLP
jgi:hypothetical protein